MIKWKPWLKYVLLGIILALSIVLSKSSLLLAQSAKKETPLQQAEVLIQTGRTQLNQDQPAEALKSWQEAMKLYRQLNNSEGITESLIYQNFALQKLGLHSQACTTLLSALKLGDWICAPTIVMQSSESIKEQVKTEVHKLNLTPLNLLGLQSLGEILRLNYKLNESEAVLEEALSLTQKIPSDNVSDIVLALGNTKQSIYQKARDEYKWIEEPLFRDTIVNLIPQKAQESLNNYQLLDNQASIPVGVKLQSQLNRLNLLLDFDEWLTDKPKLVDIHTKVNQQIQPLVNLILQNHEAFSHLSAEQSIRARLKFANNLSKIQGKSLQSVAIQYATSALETAKSINSQRLESKSLGTLGKLSPEKSQTYFEKALSLAQSINDVNIAYEWQQQLGNLYQRQGKSEAAIQAYGATIDSLTQIRDNFLSSNSDAQFFFYEKVEPVYRTYMQLLAASPSPNLELIRQTYEQFQVAELEDYLKCGKLNLVALNEIQDLSTVPAIIHIIDLANTIEVIVQSPGGSPHHHSVDSKLVRTHIDALLEILQNERLVSTKEQVITSHYQVLYKELIAPLKRYLPDSGTLIFILDKSFQSLPMNLLHDGKDFLVKRYSFSETLGSRVRIPKSLRQDQMKALIAALSIPSPSLTDSNAPPGAEALPQARQEAEDIRKLTNSSLTLLDKEFTSSSFGQKISKETFPLVHISTHGQFSSQLMRTGFLAYDRQINIREFDTLIRNKTQASSDIIELLVLSACQTAKGNRRSSLGIAGVAVQAGARSTLATLWLVEADSTVVLMEEFYKGLRNGLTKAEALRQAQLALMKNPKYTHPYYWAPFLLVGSWL
ncbi:CHAT domain-containing protein [Komarekiella sp. 'clone 1']|uniref:CHAT domain-containing protein n=1 Tax=Komarekiella delphini-convector SJRDD-AB1 TaxID=2593771 RepID=A0AA40VV05_9NOST|nr:CHAT domain-containing protein [Komarekiella delphini-convector]MBD6620642.1 CHAT domain-containing protein [Komarekiella delphini-convector SJRDD-AB1]